MRALSIKTVEQGAPVIAGGIAYKDSKDIVCLLVHLVTDRCHVKRFNKVDEVPCVHISSQPPLGALTNFNDRVTQISFPEYPGWEVFAAIVIRNTLHVVIIRGERE